MPSIADKSAIALLNEFTEANAGPFFQKVVRTAAALFGVYTVYKFLWKFIPGAHRLPKMELKNKTVLIVGASTGLGRALAFEFYARGAKLILAARSLDKLKELCVELKNTGAEKGWNNENQPDFGYLDLNNGTTTSIEKQVETLIRNKDAKIDVLVSNAGLSNRGSCMETSMVVQRRVMEVVFFIFELLIQPQLKIVIKVFAFLLNIILLHYNNLQENFHLQILNIFILQKKTMI
jgi:hypothetical protein